MSRRWNLLSGVAARHVVQIAFLLLFVALFAATRPRPPDDPSPWLKFFFFIDPLLLLATWLTTHTVLATSLFALIVVAVTAIAGRVFCGWVCPLGTLHAIAGWVFDRVWPDRKRRDHWSPWQRTKYYLLLAMLVMAALGSHWVCVFDPLVLLYRSTAVAVLPGFQWAVEESSTAVYHADPGVGPVRLTKATEPAYAYLRDNVFVLQHRALLASGLIFAIFLATLLLNKYRLRFWCRYLCPLGALLGLFAWRPMLRRAVNRDTCNKCDVCAMACHGAAGASPGDEWKAAECFGCLNCTNSCRRESLQFTWVTPWRKEPKAETIDLSKRATIAAALGGVAGLCLMRSTPHGRGNRFEPLLIRPPGARPEREFLQRCTSCGLCMKICPTGGLQPTWSEAGLEGIWTPRLVPAIGQCDYNCTLCGHICPTEAIQPLPVEEKQKVRIGLAAFDVSRCIPYAYDRDCMVCEEHCPIPDKAIYFLDVEVRDRNGAAKTIKRPHVDPAKCIGCGICENVCPYRDLPAVRVTSANESRNPDNQPILPSDGPY